jgi:predicted helicase
MWGTQNEAIYTLAAGAGKGPVVVVCGELPDYHAFRGSFGGYAFPLLDNRPGGHSSNMRSKTVDALSVLFSKAVTADDLFSYVVGVLSATSYSSWFAADLEDTFPHVPIPKDHALFAYVSELGRRIRALETFRAEPAKGFQIARLGGKPADMILDLPRRAKCFVSTGGGLGQINLKADQTLRVDNVPLSVWDFQISGYQVVYRWLEARNGRDLDKDLQRGLLDLVARVGELLHLFDAGAALLEPILKDTVTAIDLGTTAASSSTPSLF